MRILTLLLACFLIHTQGYYYGRKEDAETLIKRAYEAWNEARWVGDVETYIALHTDDAVLIPPGELPVHGKQAIRKHRIERDTLGKAPKSVVLNFLRIVERCGANTFVVRHSAKLIDSEGIPFTTNGVRVFKLENGIAKVKMAIWNRDAPTKERKKQPRKQPRYPVYPYGNNYYYQGYKNPEYYNYRRYHGYGYGEY